MIGPGTDGIEIGRHGTGERLAGRRHGADRQGLLHPGADEPDLVVEPEDLLLLEAPDLDLDLLLLRLEGLFELLLMRFELLFDPALQRALFQFEQSDLLFDLALKHTLLELEKPDVLFKLLFESHQRWKRHRGDNATWVNATK